jgi:hypothetical protein
LWRGSDMNFWEFLSDSPFLSFFLFAILCQLVISLYKIPFRHMNIKHSGWPPEHLDADGDLKKDDD